MRRHFYNALGGHNTVFLAATFGYFGHHSGYFVARPLVTPFISRTGALSLLRNTSIVAAPVFTGVVVGCAVFGEPAEVQNLMRNYFIYRQEFKSIGRETLYE